MDANQFQDTTADLQALAFAFVLTLPKIVGPSATPDGKMQARGVAINLTFALLAANLRDEAWAFWEFARDSLK